MLHLIQSNKMECLAQQLMTWLDQGSINAGNIFDADTILVQSPGMAQWLKIQIAENLGIAANLDFPLPSSFIWQLYRQYKCFPSFLDNQLINLFDQLVLRHHQ